MFANNKKNPNKNCNSFVWIASVLVLQACLILSCTQEAFDTGGSSITADGKVLISLSLHVPTSDIVQTRATPQEEDQISTLDVIVFDADRKLSQKSASATFSTTWKVALAPSRTTQYIYALANLSTVQRTNLENLAVGTGYDEVRAGLTLTDVTAGGVEHPFQMYSSELAVSGISPTMGTQFIVMKRAVARIDVKVTGGLTTTDFEIESVTLLNAAKKYNPIPAATPDLLTGEDVIRYSAVTATSNSVESAIYCYENNSTSNNPTQLLIKGKYKSAATSGYYLLNMVYNKNNTSCFDIKRNYKYTVNITKVNNSGHNTEAGALAGPPSNDMISEIEITDGESSDMVSNGSYYLGLSNSECLFYTSEAHNNELVATFTHNAPATAGNITVGVEGVGLTLNAASIIPTPNGSVQNGEIRVDIANTFASGSIIIKLGNLEKTIKINRDAQPLSYGGAFNLGDTYIYAKKLDMGPNNPNTDWIKLSPNEDSSVGDDEIDQPGGSIYMQLDINLTLLGGKDRSCDLICARSNYEGRVKIKVAQYAFDIFEYNGQINNTYVGTFHRWNQVGERVIYMPNPSSVWVATVVAGQDFIKLAPGGSSDPGFGTNSPDDAENYPVPGNSTIVINTTPGAPILFKVGMKTPLSSADAQPRYGLILVSHAGGTNRIFVRQGEAPDYVMRKTDPIGSPADEVRSDRPSAVRFAPFHLTDPARTSGRVDLGGNRGVFVQYPSIGGYHFKANQSYAWSPDIISATGWKDSGQNSDPCPPGYRRLRDGVDGNDGLIEGSEMRQSLWYYPKNGKGSSDYYNTIRGAIADGYYDRLAKTETNVDATYKAIVAGNGIDAAFIGTIIFNPHTNASIFLPAAGSRLGESWQNGNLDAPGKDTFWWTSTLSGPNAWYGAMTYYNRAYTFDNYTSSYNNGFSMRCVSETNP